MLKRAAFVLITLAVLSLGLLPSGATAQTPPPETSSLLEPKARIMVTSPSRIAELSRRVVTVAPTAPMRWPSTSPARA